MCKIHGQTSINQIKSDNLNHKVMLLYISLFCIMCHFLLRQEINEVSICVCWVNSYIKYWARRAELKRWILSALYNFSLKRQSLLHKLSFWWSQKDHSHTLAWQEYFEKCRIPFFHTQVFYIVYVKFWVGYEIVLSTGILVHHVANYLTAAMHPLRAMIATHRKWHGHWPAQLELSSHPIFSVKFLLVYGNLCQAVVVCSRILKWEGRIFKTMGCHLSRNKTSL